MNYQEFIENVKNYISNQLSDDQKVTVQPVTKNNGIVYDGLFIMDPILNISPTIYLNPYYHRYLNGVSLEDIYDDILTTYYSNMPIEDFDISIFTDFSQAQKRIVMKLINYQRNKTLLQNVPHIPYMDLAIVFICIVIDFSNEFGSILVHNEHLKLWDIKADELYQTALKNSPKLLPYRMGSLVSIMEGLTDQSFSTYDIPQMFLLTNNLKVLGASCILYPGVLEKIAQQLDSNLIIIPSSIHEVLIFPEKNRPSDSQIEDFDATIREVNETQLTDDEILGDHAYLYNRKTKTLEY